MSANQWNTDPSSTLLRTVIKEMGLRSVSIDRGCGVLPKGKTLAHFHKDGTQPSLIEELNMDDTGRLNIRSLPHGRYAHGGGEFRNIEGWN